MRAHCTSLRFNHGRVMAHRLEYAWRPESNEGKPKTREKAKKRTAVGAEEKQETKKKSKAMHREESKA